ncbi:MAG TPA: hypothetical protein VHA74_00415 [Candidatus Dojkabacteria bacterium]|nr:hypothetical protein [Candidatus Dojkabacteria bacterium]
MPKTQKRTINLLEPIGQPSDAWTAIYNWVLNVGRYLMLSIEILVLAVFFSRFILDRQNNDLTNQINDNVTILSNQQFRNQEVFFQNLNSLFFDITTIKSQQPLNSNEISSVLSSIPSGLKVDNFTFDNNRISMNVSGTDITVIKNYEFSLRQNPQYGSVAFTVSRSGLNSSLYTVSISFNILNS